MIYENTQPGFSLQSVWNCHTTNLGGGAFAYKIVHGPTSSGYTLTFPVSIPAGAYVKRVWLTIKTNIPLSGAAYKLFDGHFIPPSNTIDLNRELFVPSMTEYKASFSFKANGIVYEDYDEHTSTLTVSEPTLHIEYITDETEDEGIEIVPDTSNTSDNDPSDGRFLLPKLLNANLDEVTSLVPDNVSLELNLQPLSTARVRLAAGQPEVKIRDFVELFAPSGSVGVYRVNELNTIRGGQGGQELYLEHALTTLSDSLAIGVQAMTGPVASVFATLLAAQDMPYWVLGDCDVPVDVEIVYEYTYDNLLKTIIKLYELLPDGYVLEFNTRVRPFVLHIRKVPEEEFCECRMSRNLDTAHIRFEDSELCTRLYPFGAGEGTDRIELTTLTGKQYVDASTVDTWGVVTKTFTEDDIYDAMTLQDVANRYLERHKDPRLSVELDALDLYAATGEPLDRFRMGYMCRMPMPQYNTTMYERVISKSYPDVYGSPHNVTVTLSNKIKTVADEIASLMREATHSKLLGGSVKSEEITSSHPGIYVESPYGQTFSIKEYGTLIAVRLTYKCVNASTAIPVSCRVSVDGHQVPQSEDKGGVVDILKYLDKDSNGIPLVGDHVIGLSPMSNTGVKHNVSTRLLIKTIERK